MHCRFQLTDNSCKPAPAALPLPQRAVKAFKQDVKALQDDVVIVEEEAQEALRSFGKGFTVLESRLESELEAEERRVGQELRQVRQGALTMIINAMDVHLLMPLLNGRRQDHKGCWCSATLRRHCA